MAEENIKNVKLKIGTVAQFQEKMKDLPLNTIVGVTDPIDESDLSAEVVAKLTAGENALPKPTNTTTGTTGQFLQKTDGGSVWATVGPYSTATNLLNGGASGALVINGASSSSTGTYSVMLGYANKTAKVNALANGHDNAVNASNGFTTGYNNTLNENASAAIVAGYNNTVKSPNTITAGHNCVNETANGIVAGLYCETHCPGSLVVGRYLRASSGSQAQVIFGNYNVDHGNDGSPTAPLFIIGNGTSDTARNNLVEIRNNGEMRLNNVKVALITDIPQSTESEVLEISPSTAVKGTFTDEQYAKVATGCCIKLNGEYYRLSDNGNTEGIISYAHQGWDGSAIQDKSINITISTKSWALVVGKQYRHYIRLQTATATVYYDFPSTQSAAYTTASLPVMPDNAMTTLVVLINGIYSNVSGLVYRSTDGTLKVIAHGMYSNDGTTVGYLNITGEEATLQEDIVA